MADIINRPLFVRDGKRGTPPMTHEQFTHAFYNESLQLGWATFDTSVMVVGVLVHINLNLSCGVAMMFVGVALLITTGTAWVLWNAIGDENLAELSAMRRTLLAVRHLLIAAFLGLIVWTGVVMIKRI